jgi:hypothetical protein
MSLPRARSYDEIYLYMGLRPCTCGAAEFVERTSTPVTVKDEPGERFTDRCRGCGRQREFTFARPPVPSELSFDVRYGEDDPSQIIDPGEWLGVAELYAGAGREEPDDDASEDEIVEFYRMLTVSLAALDEVVKFLPDGADMVPGEAFWSRPGLLVYEMVPDRFTRASLEESRAVLRQRIQAFTDRFADDGEDLTDDEVATALADATEDRGRVDDG